MVLRERKNPAAFEICQRSKEKITKLQNIYEKKMFSRVTGNQDVQLNISSDIRNILYYETNSFYIQMRKRKVYVRVFY